MGWNIDDMREPYKTMAKRQLATVGRVARKVADVEPGAGNALLATQKVARPDGPYRIVVVEYRHRQADTDGACFKYVLDALVSAGVCQDDDAETIGKIEKEQIKIAKDQLEKTVIRIYAYEINSQSGAS